MSEDEYVQSLEIDLKAKSDDCDRLENELRIAHGYINQLVFRPKHPLDALSYNELQEMCDSLKQREKELEKHLRDANRGAATNANINQSFLNKITTLQAREKELEEALNKASGFIESEYCSHDGPHSEKEDACYASFIYEALSKSRGSEAGSPDDKAAIIVAHVNAAWSSNPEEPNKPTCCEEMEEILDEKKKEWVLRSNSLQKKIEELHNQVRGLVNKVLMIIEDHDHDCEGVCDKLIVEIEALSSPAQEEKKL